MLILILTSFFCNPLALADQNYDEASEVYRSLSLHTIAPTAFGKVKAVNTSFHLAYYESAQNHVPVLIPLNTEIVASQNFWWWDESAPDLLNKIRNFYTAQPYLRDLGMKARPYPYLLSWGELYHPPVHHFRELSTIITSVSEYPFFENALLRAPDTQAHFDIMTGNELTAGNQITLLENNESYHEKLRLAQEAANSIYISQLAISCDSSSAPMLSALSQAVKKGLKVKLLLDQAYAKIAGSCVREFIQNGIEVTRVKSTQTSLNPLATANHSSFWIFDRHTLIIGAQNLAQANNQSTGFNFKDRDTDLKISGPAATDALKEFIEVWNENKNEKDASFDPDLKFIDEAQKQEHAQGLRGQENYASWSKLKRGLCRVAFQRPNHLKVGISSLLIEAIEKSQHVIEITTTQLKTKSKNTLLSEIMNALKNNLALRVDLIGNGIDGGDGELSMELNDLSSTLLGFSPFLGKTLNHLNHQDSIQKALANHDELLALSRGDFFTYQYFNFYHGKQWYFDRTALLVGSMNLDSDSFENHYEGAAMCFDEALNKKFEVNQLLDLVNSVPVVN